VFIAWIVPTKSVAGCDCVAYQLMEPDTITTHYERVKGYTTTWRDDPQRVFTYTAILEEDKEYVWLIYDKKGKLNDRLRVDIQNTKRESLASNINLEGFRETQVYFSPPKNHLYMLEITLANPQHDYCNCGYLVLYVKKDP